MGYDGVEGEGEGEDSGDDCGVISGLGFMYICLS